MLYTRRKIHTEHDRKMLRKFLENLYAKINSYTSNDDEVVIMAAYFAGEKALDDDNFEVFHDESTNKTIVNVSSIPEQLMADWVY